MTNALDRYQRPAAPTTTPTQATAVEQARAVAEVQAAIVVAQANPRDIARAVAEMRDSCGRIALASRAFYAVKNRGSGLSVHLARELARIWGNVDYGVHELRRDDAAGMSEVRAFAWDQEVNVRSTRTFQVPHQRMVGRERKPLIDLGDIYLSNQNVGARAVRECIFSMLPAWFTEEAQELCRATIAHGADAGADEVPLPDRIAKAVDLFGKLGITLDQLEQQVGRPRDRWDVVDVTELSIVYTSITRDGIHPDEVFPPKRVTAEQITGERPNLCPEGYPDGKGCPVHDAPEARQKPEQQKRQSAYSTRGNRPAGADLPINKRTLSKLHASFSDAGIVDRDVKLAYCATVIGHQIDSTEKLTAGEASKVIDQLVHAAGQAAGETDPPAPPDDEPDPNPQWTDPEPED